MVITPGEKRLKPGACRKAPSGKPFVPDLTNTVCDTNKTSDSIAIAVRLNPRPIGVLYSGWMQYGSARLFRLAEANRSRHCRSLPIENSRVKIGGRTEPQRQETHGNCADSGAVDSVEVNSLNEKTQVKPGNSSVVRGGLEPPTHGFSVRCSTN